MANPPYDVMSGFQIGQQLAGPNALGIAIQQVLGRVNQLQQAKMENQFRLQQIGAEAKAKFQYDPEAQAKTQAFQAISSMTQPPVPAGGYNPQEVQAGIPGQVGEAAQGRKLKLFQQYGLLPKSPLSLEEIFARSEAGAAGQLAGKPLPTPEQEASRAGAIEEAKRIKEQAVEIGTLRQHLDVIKQALTHVPAIGGTGSTFLNPAVGMARRAAGPFDPRFRDVQTTIDASLGPFLTAVERLSRGRLTQGEINKLGNMIRDLPLLTESDRQNRFQLIDQLLAKGGITQEGVSGGNPEVESVKARLRAKYGR